MRIGLTFRHKIKDPISKLIFPENQKGSPFYIR